MHLICEGLNMSHLDTIHAVLDSRGISWVQLGAVVGLSPNDFYDVVSHEGQIWHVSLATFMRLAVALDLTPAQLLPDNAYLDGQGYTATPLHGGSAGLSYDLAELIVDRHAAAEAIAYHASALDVWLTDDYHLSQMPLIVLNVLCRYLDISIAEALGSFWHGIGREL